MFLQKINTPLFREKLKLKLKTIFLMTAIWLVAVLFFLVIELFNRRTVPGSTKLDQGTIIWLMIISVTIAGVITGIFEAFISEKRYARLHFGKLILYNTIYYLALYFGLFITGIFLYQLIEFPGEISPAGFPGQVGEYFLTPHAWLSFLILSVIVFFSLFILRTREKFGPGTLSRFLAGKYFYPREENRIFMFLDLKSSTAIAEKLGPLKYHQFLNDFYRDITYPILYKKGEIYQYVGDEISVSWNEKDGAKNLNCIECFFEIEKAINHAAGDFILKYGVSPEFKAGFHAGKTVAGEIGIIKREIVYSGDALNTTARIQELCNLYGEKIIISDDLLELLDLDDSYEIRNYGEKYLRGRTTGIHLFGVSKRSPSKVNDPGIYNFFPGESMETIS
jgi:adenylate cyclase